MRGGLNFKTRSDLESTDERLHNDMKQNAEYVCFRSFYHKGNLKTLFVLKLELPPRDMDIPHYKNHVVGVVLRTIHVFIPALFAFIILCSFGFHKFWSYPS
jgi:hypothetical protein